MKLGVKVGSEGGGQYGDGVSAWNYSMHCQLSSSISENEK